MAFFNKLFGKNTGSGQPDAPAAQTAKAPAKRGAAPAAADSKQLPCGSWLAFKGATKESIVSALGMTEVRPCAWEEGLRTSGAPEGLLFVTSPVKGCNLVIGSALPDLAYRSKATGWLADLGAYIPSVYAFTAQPNVQVYAFAQVEEQALYRIYAVAQGSVRINKGERSDAEEALGYKMPSNDDELFEPEGLTVPSVETIRALAAYWSIDPSQASGTGGLIGKVKKI